jgi:hypothetical protein
LGEKLELVGVVPPSDSKSLFQPTVSSTKMRLSTTEAVGVPDGTGGVPPDGSGVGVSEGEPVAGSVRSPGIVTTGISSLIS